MAISAATNWYIRAAGDELNGGGYDSTISGAGTNYCDQDAAQLSLTDVVTVGTTTVTSVTGGFTSAMIGNCIRIAGDAYYFITARASTNSITVDRATGTGTGQNARVGGAHASLVSYSNGGSGLPTPLIATPLAAGHIINIRGSGSSDPSSVDYDFSAGYWTFPAGDGTVNGAIQLVGYNGRPLIGHCGLLFYDAGTASTYWRLDTLKFKQTVSTYSTYGAAGIKYGVTVVNCIFDCNGVDGVGVTAAVVVNCEFRNSGSAATGTDGHPAIQIGQAYFLGLSHLIFGNYIHGWRSNGIDDIALTTGLLGSIGFNIISGCGLNGIRLLGTSYSGSIYNNTIDGNGSAGVVLANALAMCSSIYNNIFSNNGGYGLDFTVNLAGDDRIAANGFSGHNDYYNNSSGARNNRSASPGDLALDPQYTNAAGGDFSIGTNLKAKGFPSAFPGGASTGYLDIGAVQRLEAGSASNPLNVSYQLRPKIFAPGTAH